MLVCWWQRLARGGGGRGTSIRADSRRELSIVRLGSDQDAASQIEGLQESGRPRLRCQLVGRLAVSGPSRPGQAGRQAGQGRAGQFQAGQPPLPSTLSEHNSLRPVAD